MNETHVTIVGRMISKPDYRRTANDVEITKFRLASNERRYDRDSGTWVDGDTLYVNVTCWRRVAFGVHACLDKGDPVVVTGRLFTRGFEIDGQRRSVTEMDATAIGPDVSKCTVKVHRRREVEQAAAAGADQDTRADQQNREESEATADGLVPVAA